MNVVSIIVATCVFVVAAVWLSVGVAGMRGALPRNRWVGVRTEETLRSEDTFRVANRVAGPGMAGAAIILVAGGLLTLGVDGGWSVVFGLGALLAALVIVGVVSGYGVRAAQLVPDEPAHSCGCCSAEPAATSAPTAASTDVSAGPDSTTPADDCGESSCASCTLRGACGVDTSARDTAQA